MSRWDIVGARVRFTMSDEDYVGHVVACHLQPGSTWFLLVLTSDGNLHSLGYRAVTLDLVNGSPYRD